MSTKKPSFNVTVPADAPRYMHDYASANNSNVRSVSGALDATNTSLAATQTQLGSKMTVANLPTPVAGLAGNRNFVTDATATTFASVVAGGGANGVPVYCDGTNWRIG